MKTRDLSDVDTVEDYKNKKKLPITLHLDKGRSQIRYLCENSASEIVKLSAFLIAKVVVFLI